MSRINVVPQTVMNWVDASVSKEDCELWYAIDDLKKSVLKVAMLQEECRGDDETDTLQSVSDTLVRALRRFSSLYDELKDQIVPSAPRAGVR